MPLAGYRAPFLDGGAPQFPLRRVSDVIRAPVDFSHQFLLLFPNADDRDGAQGRKEPLLGARLSLLTIKMSAPSGSFLSQYLLF